MTITSGFFNAISGDRAYNANHLNGLFEGLLEDGVLQSVDNGLAVAASTGMQVTVKSGRAWFNKSWIDNDGDYVVGITSAHPTLNRIDAVVLDFNRENATRANTIIVVDGTPAAGPLPPTMIDTADHKQYPLAYISVDAAVTEILGVDIENKIGTTLCPFASGILENMDLELLLAQWDAEFMEWFDEMKDQLSVDAAGNLQNQIDDHVVTTHHRKNIIHNGGMTIEERPTSQVTYQNEVGLAGIVDRWRITTDAAGIFQVSYSDVVVDGVSKRFMRMTRNTYNTTSTQYTYISQFIEGGFIGNLWKGTPNARNLQLSFEAYASAAHDFVVELVDKDNGRHVAFLYSATTGVNRFEIEIPKDFTGVLDNDTEYSLELRFWLAAGSNYTSGTLPATWASEVNANRAAGQWLMTASGWLALSQVQLEIGEKATPFEVIPDDEQLLICQRYFEAFQGTLTGYGAFFDGTRNVRVPVRYRVKKREAPVINPINWVYLSRHDTGATVGLTSLASFLSSPTDVYETLIYGYWASRIAGDAYQCAVQMDIDAEL